MGTKIVLPFDRKWLSDGNGKYRYEKKVRVLTWGLPPVVTCPGAGECKRYCYARQGRMGMRDAVNAQNRRLALSKSPEFGAVIHCELVRRRVWDMIRIHDTGDFYNQRYLKDWVTLAEEFPNNTFFAYTKMVPLFKRFGELPRNFKVIYSMGGKWDNLINLDRDNHSRVFPTLKEATAAGYKVSPDFLPLSFHTNHTREGFVYHGTKLWKNT